jgi:hypothetical protein
VQRSTRRHGPREDLPSRRLVESSFVQPRCHRPGAAKTPPRQTVFCKRRAESAAHRPVPRYGAVSKPEVARRCRRRCSRFVMIGRPARTPRWRGKHAPRSAARCPPTATAAGVPTPQWAAAATEGRRTSQPPSPRQTPEASSESAHQVVRDFIARAGGHPAARQSRQRRAANMHRYARRHC